MIAELTLGRLAPDDDRAAPRTWVVALAAAVRALTVGVSIVLLAGGLTLILWASAPDSTADAANAVQAGVVAFAAAHLIPVTVGGVSVSLSPLLITGAVVGLLGAVTRRARLRPLGRTQEVVAVVSTAAVYGLFVSVVARSFAPVGSVPPTAVLTAGGLALLAAAWGTAAPDGALRGWWATAPLWLRLGARAGTAAALALLAAGALAVVTGLALSFSSVAALTGMAAPGVGAGLGLTVLQLTLLPNAAVAGTGYITGVGFNLGAGHYSPFGSTMVELPGVPLLAAAPEGVGASGAGLVWLAVPVAVAVLVGRWVAQRTDAVLSRFLAVGTAAVTAGCWSAGLALAARGGVQGGSIAVTGAPAVVLGAVVVAGVALIGGLTVLAHSGSAVRSPRKGPGEASGSASRKKPDHRPADGTTAAPAAAPPVADEPAGSPSDGANTRGEAARAGGPGGAEPGDHDSTQADPFVAGEAADGQAIGGGASGPEVGGSHAIDIGAIDTGAIGTAAVDTGAIAPGDPAHGHGAADPSADTEPAGSGDGATEEQEPTDVR